MKKSGTLSNLILYLIFSLLGCAVIRHTPYNYTKKDLYRILSGKKLVPDTFIVRYRIGGKGLSISGKARIQRENSLLIINTYSFFTGRKILKFSIGNSGYGILDFAGLYLFGENPLEKFTFAGTTDKNTFSFIRKLDTINIRIKEGRVISIEEKEDYILLFYSKDGKLSLVRGQMEGFSFEGSIVK